MQLVYLGKINKPHGLKGAVFFQMENSEDSQVKSGKQVFIHGHCYEVEFLNTSGSKPILKLKEINSRNELEKVLPAEVYMDREEFDGLESGGFYLNDTIGFVVESTEGEVLGKVSHFYSNGAQEIVVVEGGVEKLEVPLVEPFIKNVSLEKKILTILKPEVID